MAVLAEILTSEKNGRLARTIVNRIWARLMGRGLIEPNDDMDRPPWDEDLLDWLATDFVENGYAIKKTMERILTSEAYQLPAVSWDGKAKDAFTFQGPVVKRLSAEQFCDALSAITGIWEATPAAKVEFAAEAPPIKGVRSWLTKRNMLTVSLGRPSREQVVSQRPSAATTLQGLELTNGETLAKRLKEGAKELVRAHESATDALIRDVYLRAMSRSPSQEEFSAVAGLIEDSTGAEGVEDFLWAVAMLPEFQLIY